MGKKVDSTKNYIFDTDCLSTFLGIGYEEYLFKLFKKIIIPRIVYDELCKYISNNKPKFKERLDELIAARKIIKCDFEIPSEEALLFYEMTHKTEMRGIKVIGDGEAACIAYAVTNKAVLCSNNMRDIRFYIEKYNLEYLTTADIFCILYEQRFMGLYEIEKCWSAIKKHSYLPEEHFSDYYEKMKSST